MNANEPIAPPPVSPLLRTGPRRVGWLITVALSSALGVAAIIGLVAWRYGSVGDALAAMRGHTMRVSPRVADLGRGNIGTTRIIEYRLRNLSSKSISFLGAQTQCTCMLVNEHFPFEIAPFQVRAIRLSSRIPPPAGQFHQTVTLYTDSKRQHFVGLEVCGVALDNRSTTPPATVATRSMDHDH